MCPLTKCSGWHREEVANGLVGSVLSKGGAMKITVTETRASGEYAIERVIEVDISDRDGFEADESRESDEAESPGERS